MKKTRENLPRVKLFGRRRGRCEFVGQLGIPSELCIHSLNGTWPFLNAKSKSKSLSLRLSLCWVLNPNDDLILLLVDCGGKPQLSMWSGFLALQSFMKCWWKYEWGRYLSWIYRFWKQSIFVFMSFELSALQSNLTTWKKELFTSWGFCIVMRLVVEWHTSATTRHPRWCHSTIITMHP